MPLVIFLLSKALPWKPVNRRASIRIMLIQRLWEFGRNFRNFFTALADASEMAEVFRQQDVEVDAETAQALTIAYGAIDFNNICFTYNEANTRQTQLFEN